MVAALNGVTRPVTIMAEFTGAEANPMVPDEVELDISAAFEKQ